MDRDIALAELI